MAEVHEVIWRIVAATLVAASAGCASNGAGAAPSPSGWAAYGYLTPGGSEPDIIGAYATESECLDAVDEWMSRQVVGNPVSGECLPVDPR